MYGADAGSNDLAGMTNSQMAAYFQSLFIVKGQRLDAQVLATALSAYVTNATLAGNTAAPYGFLISDNGLGTATFSVGARGAAFSVPNNSTVTVMDLLLATNHKSRGGVLYYDLNFNVMKSLRDLANTVYSDLNEAGDFS
jgi:hypothetical protein